MTEAQTLAAQNDAFRQGMFVNLNAPNKAKPAGKYTVSNGVHHLPPDDKTRVLVAVTKDNDFNADNDPYGEHDFGVIELPNVPKVYWRIAYYDDESMQYGADEPAEKCYRLMTIYLAEEH